jgi:hypothetical protein
VIITEEGEADELWQVISILLLPFTPTATVMGRVEDTILMGAPGTCKETFNVMNSNMITDVSPV